MSIMFKDELPVIRIGRGSERISSSLADDQFPKEPNPLVVSVADANKAFWSMQADIIDFLAQEPNGDKLVINHVVGPLAGPQWH